MTRVHVRWGMLLLGSACGPRADDTERPEWLPEWSLVFDVDREREGSFDEFVFEDDGRAFWNVQEFCPLERATLTAELRWEAVEDDVVAVRAIVSASDGITFPYDDMRVEQWDCDELVFYATTPEGEQTGFRGHTWGRVCFADDGCRQEYCEGTQTNSLEECPR